MSHFKKAVIAAGGAGTRFLPITKSVPKEMLPLAAKPVVQYAVEEITASGIKDITFVIAHGKESVVDYFSPDPGLETLLVARGDASSLRQVRGLSRMAHFSRVYQSAPLGLGHAAGLAAETVGDEPFALVLPDDVIDAKEPVLKQMLEVYKRHPGNILLVEKCRPEDTGHYGIIDAETTAPGVYRVKGLVEKPRPQDAPSNLAIVGRYLLMPQIFEALSRVKPGKGGEIQLTDAIQLLLEDQPVFACEFEGTRYDTGTPEGWLAANNAWADKLKPH
ncbi:MAG: UTP--glucose-1-phosphate uridylyltransferase [Dehalogenimonas sp.]|uniref:UTP--glucose-1-phosphate uridylyltransferase n=1 Tax=Candidatus Dehalogenimonas loeffleri TaxID=3127115 RepID=A0ABZ2J5H8_9CHLR|nr:UTP--glucose-1-phosphate uridylyltransferase [Dehalogenimonas sp.]